MQDQVTRTEHLLPSTLDLMIVLREGIGSISSIDPRRCRTSAGMHARLRDPNTEPDEVNFTRTAAFGQRTGSLKSSVCRV